MDYFKGDLGLGLNFLAAKTKGGTYWVTSFSLFLTKECIQIDLQEPDIFLECGACQNFQSVPGKEAVLDWPRGSHLRITQDPQILQTHGAYRAFPEAEVLGGPNWGRRLCL